MMDENRYVGDETRLDVSRRDRGLYVARFRSRLPSTLPNCQTHLDSNLDAMERWLLFCLFTFLPRRLRFGGMESMGIPAYGNWSELDRGVRDEFRNSSLPAWSSRKLAKLSLDIVRRRCPGSDRSHCLRNRLVYAVLDV